VVQEAARDLAGRGLVVQVDTQSNPRLAGRFGIRSIPAVLILKRGTVAASASGAMDRNALLDWWRSNAS
jgi:thioredoxin 2